MEVGEIISFYILKLKDLDLKYLGTQSENKSLVNYKKRHWSDIKMKEVYEDFIIDLKRIKQ